MAGDTDPPNSNLVSTYADRLRTNIKFDQRLKRNVLEVFIEKSEEEDELILDQTVVARLMDSIRMNTAKEMEGYQVKYNRNGAIISVWCIQGVDLEKFCRQENIQVGRGVYARSIRPAGRKDVTVTVSGLNYNTPDSLVIEYIKKFGGQFVTEEVIYGRHGEGPLRGKINNERKYQVIFNGIQMGTFHFLDGEKVKIFYRGNMKTCGFCQKTADTCVGNGIAKECKQNGGTRLDLAVHMKRLWSKIGFYPSSFELPDSVDEDNIENDRPIKQSENFNPPVQRPKLSEDDVEKISAFEVRNIPASVCDDEVQEYIQTKIDEEIDKIEFSVKKDKKTVRIYTDGKIPGKKVLDAVNKIQFTTTKEKVFGNPLYCRIIKELTPRKENEEEKAETTNETTKDTNASKFSKLLKSPVLSIGSINDKRKHNQVGSPQSPDQAQKKKNLL